MTENRPKERLIADFNLLKSFEQSARDFYAKVSSDPRVTDEEIRNVFKRTSDDEQRHVEIVQRIMNIINNAL